MLAGTDSSSEAAATVGQVYIAGMPKNWQLQACVTSSRLLASPSSSYAPETCFVLAGWHLPLAVAAIAAPVLAGFSHAGSLLSISWVVLYCFCSYGIPRLQWRLEALCC